MTGSSSAPPNPLTSGDTLGSLNLNPNLDFFQKTPQVFNDEPNLNPFQNTPPSNFYDIPTLIKKISNSKNPIFISLNIQSLNSKIEKLKSFLLTLNQSNIFPDIIAIQETWNIYYPEIAHVPGYQLTYKTRTNANGGGVGFYVLDQHRFSPVAELSTFTEKTFEVITIEVEIGRRKFLLSNIYRSPTPPPNTSITEHMTLFNTALDTHLTNLNNTSNNSYVFLDANINLLDINNPQTIAYLENILNNGFMQLISKATRMQNNHTSLIDHILTNNAPTNTSSGTLITDISDHFTTFTQPSSNKSKPQSSTKTTRNLSKENIESFKTALRNLNWQSTLSSNNVNESFKNFWEDFHPLFNLYLPEKTVRFNKNFHKINDFLTKGLLISRNTKNSLHKIALSEPTTANLEKFKHYRNIYNSTLRKSKKIYFETNLRIFAKNPKKTWNLLKEATNLKSNTQKISEIVIGNTLSSNHSEIANHFNNFFSTIGTNISNSIDNSNIDPISYCNYPNDPPQLHLGEIGPVHFTDLVKEMTSKNSNDLDGISSSLLKKIAYEISVPLSHIFSLSLSTGIFPEQLKTSRVVPIFKSGDITNVDNYRPISLVKTFSKVLEKLVCTKLINHLELNNLIFKHQYGFLRNRSTEHALIQVLNYISDALNKNNYCIGLFLDLKKAFDVVPHDILLKKLKLLGIVGTAWDWFESYLSERKQIVDINGTKSQPKNLDISVIQGTSLGPILFLCFINDLPNATLLLSILFADDTTCLDSDPHLPTLIQRFNFEIQKMADWFKANRMALNTSKTKFIIFHAKGKKIELNGTSLVYNDNPVNSTQLPEKIFPIERIYTQHPDKKSRSFKLLGILLDENLNFNANTEHLCSKLSRSIYFINRAKHFLPLNALKSLYYALFHSHILYCPSIYSCTSNPNIKKIFNLQKKVVRIITNSKFRDHTLPLFCSLNILPLDKLIFQRKNLLMHSFIHKYSPSSFHATWASQSTINPNLNLRNANDIILPHPRTDLFKKMPLYSLPKTWNELNDMKFQFNPVTFRISLNEYLFQTLYEEFLAA